MLIINLNHLGNKWLEAKKQRMQNLLKIASPDEALYREIMLSLGYPKNKVNFLELALLFPYSEVRKLKDGKIIEKAFYTELVLRMRKTVYQKTLTKKTHPPLQDNRLTKIFKKKYSDLKITTVKEYMGVIFYQKQAY